MAACLCVGFSLLMKPTKIEDGRVVLSCLRSLFYLIGLLLVSWFISIVSPFSRRTVQIVVAEVLSCLETCCYCCRPLVQDFSKNRRARTARPASMLPVACLSISFHPSSPTISVWRGDR